MYIAMWPRSRVPRPESRLSHCNQRMRLQRPIVAVVVVVVVVPFTVAVAGPRLPGMGKWRRATGPGYGLSAKLRAMLSSSAAAKAAAVAATAAAAATRTLIAF